MTVLRDWLLGDSVVALIRAELCARVQTGCEGCPLCLLSSEYQGVRLTYHLPVVQNLRISGAMPPRPYSLRLIYSDNCTFSSVFRRCVMQLIVAKQSAVKVQTESGRKALRVLNLVDGAGEELSRLTARESSISTFRR